MFYLFALILIASVSGEKRPPVLVLSFEGIHPSTVNPNDMPYLYGLRSIAAVPEYVKSAFPTQTFVTHFTIATGVGPNGHGVYGNVQFDDTGDEGHMMRNHPNQYQSVPGIVPIWLENEIEDLKRYSGTMMWPGSLGMETENMCEIVLIDVEDDSEDQDDQNDDIDAENTNVVPQVEGSCYGKQYERGKRAHYFEPYNPYKMSWKKRADTIIGWLTNTGKEANLVMAHFEEYDHENKSTRQVRQKNHIQKIDKLIRYIREQLKAKGLDDLVDMIIMSDHGTSVSSIKDIMVWEDVLGDFGGNVLVSGPLVYFRPFIRDIDAVYIHLKNQSENGKKFNIFKDYELKDEWDVKNVKNLDKTYTIIATPPYTFIHKNKLDHIVKIRKIERKNIVQNVSGYDNEYSSMNAFFYGIGPTFKNNVYLTGEHFDLAAVYPLIRTLIGIKNKTVNDIQTNVELDPVVKKLLEDDKY